MSISFIIINLLANLFQVSISSWAHTNLKPGLYFNPYVTGYNNSIVVPLIPYEFTLKSGNRFGKAVSASGNIALVSATNLLLVNNENTVIADSAVFVFERNRDGSWIQYRDMLLSGTEILSDGFGESLAVSQQIALVGAWKDSTLGTFSGRAYVFYTNQSTSTAMRYDDRQALYASNPSPGDFFGYSVGICEGFKYFDDGVVLVGAYGFDFDNRHINTGAVYMFARTNGVWHEVDILQPSQPCAYCSFGWTIDTHEGIFAVGSPVYSESSVGDGSAYVYKLLSDSSVVTCTESKCMEQTSSAGDGSGHSYRIATTWSTVQLAVLTGSETDDQEDLFGAAVSVYVQNAGSNTGSNHQVLVTVAVSAFQDSQYAYDAGKVYVFQSSISLTDSSSKGTWSLEQKILGDAGSRLGTCLSLYNGHLLIGADYAGKAAGQAFIYEEDKSLSRSVWYRIASLPRPGYSGDYFGASCHLSDVFAVVGAYQVAGSSGRSFNMAGTGLASSYSSEAGIWIEKSAADNSFTIDDMMVMMSSIAFVSIVLAVIVAITIFRQLYITYIEKGNMQGGFGFRKAAVDEPTLGNMDVSARSTDALFVNSAEHDGLPGQYAMPHINKQLTPTKMTMVKPPLPASASHRSWVIDHVPNQAMSMDGGNNANWEKDDNHREVGRQNKADQEEGRRTNTSVLGAGSKFMSSSSTGAISSPSLSSSTPAPARTSKSKVSLLLKPSALHSYSTSAPSQDESGSGHSQPGGGAFSPPRESKIEVSATPSREMPDYATYRPETTDKSISGVLKEAKLRGKHLADLSSSHSMPHAWERKVSFARSDTSATNSPESIASGIGSERKARSLRESTRYGSSGSMGSSSDNKTSGNGAKDLFLMASYDATGAASESDARSNTK